MYLGDYKEDATVYFKWSTNDLSGASITRSADGTVKVYKNDGTTASAGTEITNVEDWNSTTGLHHCTIDTSTLAFYVAAADYFVTVEGTTIDGQTVNHPLRQFSIENRSHKHMAEDAIDGKFTFTGANVHANVQAAGVLNNLAIADVQTALTNQGYTTARAPNLDNLDAAISSLNDLSITDVQTALTNQGYTAVRAGLLDNLDQAISTLNDLSQADVQAALTAQGYTSARAPNLDNLDATISSINAAISALNDLSQSDVQAALTAQGYTTARATKLDKLDTIDDLYAAIVAAKLTVAAGSSSTNVRTDATQANDFYNEQVLIVVNAAGVSARRITDYNLTNGEFIVDPAFPFTPASGDTAYVLARTASVSTVLAAITTLNDLSQADVQAALTAQGYTTARAPNLDNLDQAISALNDLSIADVQSALTAQGYTIVRAGYLDNLTNLDAAVSAVLTAIAALNDLDQAAVQAALTAQGYTTARAAKLDNLDNLDKAITALNDLSQADVQAALTAQGYSIARAALLDNLDQAISSLNDLAIIDVQTALTNQGYTSARADMIEDLDSAIICAKLTTQAGSTATHIRTNATPGNDFYNFLTIVVIGSSGTASRRIADYIQTDGIFAVEYALPFTPQVGDLVYVISTDNSGYRLNEFAQSGIACNDISGPVQGKLGMYYYRIIPTARNAANKMTAGTKKIYYSNGNYVADTPDLTTYIEVDWSDETDSGYVTAIREHK